MNFRVRWDRIAVGCAVGAVVGGMVWWGLSMMSDPPVSESTAMGSVNEDSPVAEPTVKPSFTPDPVETVAPVDEPWLVADDGTQHFEDGSWLDADGTQGCTEGMPCDSLPPVPAGEPTTPTGGYFPTLNLRPCLVEDDENCYWDAARMGNGQGTSFIRLDGITYYPEASK